MTSVERLVLERMSMDAVPPGGTFLDGVRFLLDPQRMSDSRKTAEAWVTHAIELIRQAPDVNNPWREADDETIAAEILHRIDARKQSTRRQMHAPDHTLE